MIQSPNAHAYALPKAPAPPSQAPCTTRAGLFLLFATTFICGGATCTGNRRVDDIFQPPVVFDAAPSKQQLIASINRSLAINSIQSLNIKVSSPEIATRLRGTFTWERPLNFRFAASPGSMVFGEAIAAGSNDQAFWLKTQFPPPTQIVYASYREFEDQVGPRHILPVSPIWIREALGIIEINPDDDTQMSPVRPDGKVDLTTIIRSGQRLYSRTLVVDPTHVVISEVILKDGATQRLIAKADLSEHTNYGEYGVNLPKRVDINLHPDSGPTLAFTVEVGQYAINDGGPSDPSSFAIPDSTGVSVHDLVKLNNSLAAASGIQANLPAQRRTTQVGFQQSMDYPQNPAHAPNAGYLSGGLQPSHSGAQNWPGNMQPPSGMGLPGDSQPRYTPAAGQQSSPLQNVRR